MRTLAILLLFAIPAQSAIFGVSPKMFNRKTNEMENATQKQFAENQLKLTGLESRIEKLEFNVSAQAQTMAKVQAGYDRSISQTVGRDMTTTTTNDTGLMTEIFKGLLGLFLAIIAFMKSRLMAKDRVIKDKDVRIAYLENSRHKYQDLWLMKLDPEFAKIKMEMEKKEKKEA